jgi:hypothetical protein
MKKEIILNLDALIFHSVEEEELFDKLIQKIMCFYKKEKTSNGLNIYLKIEFFLKNKLIVFGDDDRILYGIFKRFNISNIDQCKNLKSEFPIILSLKPTYFYTNKDKELFFTLINKISLLKKNVWGGFGDEINLYFYTINLPERDLKNLIHLFIRYRLKKIIDFDFPRKKEENKLFKSMNKYRKKTYQRIFAWNKNYIPHDHSLVLDPLKFFSTDDEEIFFEWINSLSCISKIDYVGRKIYLNIKPKTIIDKKLIIPYEDFENIKLIFFRYKIRDTDQLDKISPLEETIIKYNPHPPKPFYTVPENIESKICLLIIGTSFWSNPDEDMFFEWPQKISCVTNFACHGISMYLFIDSKNISDNDLINLIGYFKRYEVQNPSQLKIFMTEENKHIFHKYNILNYEPPQKDLSWYNPKL